MNARRRWSGAVGFALVLVVVGLVGWGQFTFPWLPQGSPSGRSLDFGPVPVGTTATANYTFKVVETSEAAMTVTQIALTGGAGPFDLAGWPHLPVTLAPGQSITFQVFFSPTQAQAYTGSFVIVAQGGSPLQISRQTVTLTGEGVSGLTPIRPEDVSVPPLEGIAGLPGPDPTEGGIPGIDWELPGGPTEDVTEDLAKLEAKLDAVGRTLDEFREKLDSLGWWLGELTVGWPIRIEPFSTNPRHESNLWEMIATLEAKLDQLLYEPWTEDLLASLEAKLDVLLQQPPDVTITEINVAITEIYALIVDLSQLVININQVTVNINPLIVNINQLVININQLIINIGANLGKIEAKLDRIEAELDAIRCSNRRIEAKLDLLLGYPPEPNAALITLTVDPALASAQDHVATVEGAADAVAGGATVRIYWLGRDAWTPGVTDPWYLDTTVANPDGSFLVVKDGWGSTWPNWCEVTQSNDNGEGTASRVPLSTVMILM